MCLIKFAILRVYASENFPCVLALYVNDIISGDTDKFV